MLAESVMGVEGKVRSSSAGDLFSCCPYLLGQVAEMGTLCKSCIPEAIGLDLCAVHFPRILWGRAGRVSDASNRGCR